MRQGATVLMLLVTGLFAFSAAQEKTIKRANVPKPVLDAFAKAYPNAKATEFSTEIEDGRVLYEIESVEGKTHRDVTFDAAGALIVTEETIAETDLPEPIRAALKKDYANTTIRRCEKMMEGSSTVYEVAMTSGKKRSEVVFNADGGVVKK